jgi:hypothetical protein
VLIPENLLQISFKVDNKVNCMVRVSVCVTEQKNDLNAPVMFYTPAKDGFIQNINLFSGMG